MRTIMDAKSPHESSFSFSRRYFNWRKKVVNDEDNYEEEEEEILSNKYSSSHFFEEELKIPTRKKRSSSKLSVSKWALTLFGKNHYSQYHSSLGTKVIGTLFGYRRGHVHFAFQEDPKLSPAFLIELAMPTSVLVREMASGLVRIALECESSKSDDEEEKKKKKKKKKKKNKKLVEESSWRTYCNGKKYGFGGRRECGLEEWKVLKAVEPITIGAGVLPGILLSEGNEDQHRSELGEVMYMRARFERIIGSKDSEAFYMMNPDGSGGPELSIYLLRV